MDATIRIQLVDDHPIFRRGCKSSLSKYNHIKIIIESCCGEDAIQDYRLNQPDIVLMDLVMPNMGGIEALKQIVAEFPEAKIIILSMADDSTLTEAMQVGAKGILSKTSILDSELSDAIQAVYSGGNYIDVSIANRIALRNVFPEMDQLNLLTPREMEVLIPLLNGKTITQTAHDLALSPKTVRVHKSSLMKKLAVSNMVDLTHIGIREGLIQS